MSDGNLAGINPLGVPQLFVIETDGTGIVQLTKTGADGYPDSIAISADGTKVLFTDDRNLTTTNPDGSRELFKILATSAGLRQVTADSEVYHTALSGDGTTIAYSGLTGLISVSWDPGTFQFLHGSTNHTITDDGGWVYFQEDTPRTVFKIPSTGGTPVTVWNTGEGIKPVIAGGGTRLLFLSTGEDAPFTTNPDAIQLLASDQDGGSPELIVDSGERGAISELEMTADGRWITFLWGGGPQEGAVDVFLADVDSGDVDQLTERAGAYDPDISDDGNIILFLSELKLVDDGCDNNGGTYIIGPDGSGLQRLIPDPATCHSSHGIHAVISGDGTKVVQQDGYDPAGTNPLGWGVELYGVGGSGGPVWQVTDDDEHGYKFPRIDGSGTWVVYQSVSNITGQNPDGTVEIFRIRSDGSNIDQVTDEAYFSEHPDISADGGLIVYTSHADPLGTNSDHNFEVFLYDVSTQSLEQLTDTSNGWSPIARISPNGSWVAFYSTSTWFDSSGPIGTYRIDLGTSEVQYASAGCTHTSYFVRGYISIDVDDDGNVAFVGYCDPAGANRDDSSELWISEFDIPSFFDVSDADPTLLRWDPLPWAIRYDVIRGDVASLAPGGGGTVDLGAVVCIENDSEDAMTEGDEDALQPTPGQVLFYLYRGSRGDIDGPGSWGQGTAGERIPASGSCQDAP